VLSFPQDQTGHLRKEKPRSSKDIDLASLALPQKAVNLPVGGRLNVFQDFWIHNISDSWAVQIVTEGYYIPFKMTPQLTLKIKRTILPQQQHPILLDEIAQLLQKKAIEQVDPASPGFYSTFFLVPKKDGGQRPVLNLKGLNRFVQNKTFKMVTLQIVLTHLQKGHWMASLDLKDAYFHIPIRPDFRQFLRFEFLGKVYQFKVLPFGLSTAPRVFTKILAPVIGMLHHQGVYIYPYLDDCLVVAKSKDQLVRALHLTQEVLMNAGFLINFKKSSLVPAQKLRFLGMELDSISAVAILPQSRALELAKCCKSFMKVGHYQTVRTFLRLLGLMAATLLAVPYAKLHMRPLQLFMNSHRDARIHGLSHKIMVSRALLPILRWWAHVPNLTQGLPWKSPKPAVTLTTDASLQAWGAHMQNQLEMLAVLKALKAFQVKNKSVLVQTDNTTVLSYINKAGGTKSPQLCRLTWEMFTWCMANQVTLQAMHIPGERNLLADKLSRHMSSPTEWELNDNVVQELFLIWGTPQVDLFATYENRKLPQFCSLFPHPQAMYQDALAVSWDNMFAYAFPPLAILSQVLHKIARDKVTVLLVAPMWTRREWYPLLLDLLVAFPYRLPAMRNLVTQDNGSLIHHNPAELCLVAWLLSADPSLRGDFLSKLQTHASQIKVPIHTERTSQAGIISLPGVRQTISIPVRHLSLP
jgi:hypothetical protein